MASRGIENTSKNVGGARLWYVGNEHRSRCIAIQIDNSKDMLTGRNLCGNDDL
jgi:hypothetical protein